MSKFNDFIELILSGAVDLARETLGDVPDAALADTREFIKFSKEELMSLTKDLKNKEITLDEFGELTRDLTHLAKLVALSDLGIVKTKLERFRTGLIDLVINTAKTVFLPV